MANRSNRLPKRSTRFGVGKEIGGSVYVHRSYEQKIGDVLVFAKTKILDDFDYQVVKHNMRTGAVSFVQCPDFDAAPEPIVGDILIVNVDGGARARRKLRDPEIYHHKWLFVADDYEGFNVEESKLRSLAWMKLDRVDRAKIGRKSYWDQHVAPRIENGCK